MKSREISVPIAFISGEQKIKPPTARSYKPEGKSCDYFTSKATGPQRYQDGKVDIRSD
jgi:hypothetical protein